MALNALAALLAGVALGAPADGLLEGLAGFAGVRRRFEFRGRAAGVAVYDDYAHHPTKVAAQLRRGPGRGGRGPGGRGLPAAPVLADAGVRPRVRRRARAWPTRSSCSTSTARARTPSRA